MLLLGGRRRRRGRLAALANRRALGWVVPPSAADQLRCEDFWNFSRKYYTTALLLFDYEVPIPVEPA